MDLLARKLKYMANLMQTSNTLSYVVRKELFWFFHKRSRLPYGIVLTLRHLWWSLTCFSKAVAKFEIWNMISFFHKIFKQKKEFCIIILAKMHFYSSHRMIVRTCEWGTFKMYSFNSAGCYLRMSKHFASNVITNELS